MEKLNLNAFKICSKCKIEKEIKFFNKHLKCKNGINSYCKVCKSKKDSEYRIKNKNTLSIKKLQYTLNHKKEKQEYDKIYNNKNKQRKKQYAKQYRESHKIERNLKEKEKREKNITFKLSHYLRTRINKAIKRNQRSGSAVRNLGCSIEELKIWLERQFHLGMSWDNYGKSGWHIDHKIPLANFNLINHEQFLKACHYTNLQPMWESENCSKQNRWSDI